jgi:hypothetical protein
MDGWSFENNVVNNDNLKIRKVLYWNRSNAFNGFKYIYGGFYACSNLTEVPTGGIPAHPDTSGVGSDGFQDLFNGCTLLTSVPADIFSLHPYPNTNSAFRYTFMNSGLTSVPAHLFDVQTLAPAFISTFQGSAITAIPTDLFKYNVNATNFSSLCMDCIHLTTVPAQLFKYAIYSRNFNSAFSGCNKLTVNKNIFYDDGEEATRFLNLNANFSGCFYKDSWTGSTQGTAPNLWTCNFGSATPQTTVCFGGSGNSITDLSNYADIPSGWK